MINERTVPSRSHRNVTTAAVIGLAVVLPFVLLEVINRRGYGEGFPLPLFLALWLLSSGFVYAVIPVTQTVRSGQPIGANNVVLLGRLVFLLVAAWLWTSLVSDQMPCFLGVPNCD